MWNSTKEKNTLNIKMQAVSLSHPKIKTLPAPLQPLTPRAKIYKYSI